MEEVGVMFEALRVRHCPVPGHWPARDCKQNGVMVIAVGPVAMEANGWVSHSERR